VTALSRTADYFLEQALGQGNLGQHELAVTSLRQAIVLDKASVRAWRAMSEQLFAIGDNAGSEAASTQASILAVTDSSFRSVIARLQDPHLNDLEEVLLDVLEASPDDADALNLLAEIALCDQRAVDSEVLLKRCLEIAPALAHARYNYALVLLARGKIEEAIAELTHLMLREARNSLYRKYMGEALLAAGRYQEALILHEEMVRDFPEQPLAYLGVCLALHALGRREDCIANYHEILRRFPSFAAAYWSLASLRTADFTVEEMAEMKRQLRRSGLSEDDRVFLYFSEGRALERNGRYGESFESYAAGNTIKRSMMPYDPEILTRYVARSKALFTREFFVERAGGGCISDGPIFIVGLPRSGSSLVEQILSRHSAIAALGELPGILTLVQGLRADSASANYLEVLSSLGSSQLTALGEQYIQQAHKPRERHHATDKSPRNFLDIGMIHLILPRAKIIDIRRHPIGCCFSNFTQLYVQGQAFTYSLTDLGRYYKDYVALMEHYDSVLPGKIHHLRYESLVDDFETEVQRLLEYLALPFENDCLQFHDSTRHIRTPSGDQVRKRIHADAVEHWRFFEPWLDPLKEALGACWTSRSV